MVLQLRAPDHSEEALECGLALIEGSLGRPHVLAPLLHGGVLAAILEVPDLQLCIRKHKEVSWIATLPPAGCRSKVQLQAFGSAAHACASAVNGGNASCLPREPVLIWSPMLLLHVVQVADLVVFITSALRQIKQEVLIASSQPAAASTSSLNNSNCRLASACNIGADSERQQLQQLADRMEEGLGAANAAWIGTAPLPHVCAIMKEQALPAAETVARLLRQHWAKPEQQAALQLELAQAAATRSCAYLCCAQLGGEGGPLAGEGKGSKRCGVCRTVWYCGTACSHADWRAGHKRVCKVLAAARAAAKE